MTYDPTRIAPGTATHEPVPSLDPEVPEEHRPSAPSPRAEPPPLLSDSLSETLDEQIDDAVRASFDRGSRRPRHDGFTPERIGVFLHALAATGVVEHSAAAAGVTASAAYALRNRRQGRAFARMWDAILINRARARVASELSGRSIAGCVSLRKKDGLVVSEYHYYDNRLAMSLLTRLDRLAEKEAASEAHLRALSEDLDDFVDCLASGGDADAFVEARRPAAVAPETPATDAAAQAPPVRPSWPDQDPELTTFARLSGCPDYLDVSPLEIDVLDIDPSRKSEWGADQWVRAYRSGFMTWLAIDEDGAWRGPGAAFEFQLLREAACAHRDERIEAEASGRDLSAEDAAAPDALEIASILDWDDARLARGWRSGLLTGLEDDFWEDLASSAAAGEAEE